MLCLASIGNEWIVQKQVAPIRSFYQFPNTTQHAKVWKLATLPSSKKSNAQQHNANSMAMD
jgi:hypothetical protein